LRSEREDRPIERIGERPAKPTCDRGGFAGQTVAGDDLGSFRFGAKGDDRCLNVEQTTRQPGALSENGHTRASVRERMIHRPLSKDAVIFCRAAKTLPMMISRRALRLTCSAVGA
jgi:hypothetical protein